MSLYVILDSGPLGMASNPRASATNTQCREWVDGLLARNALVCVPEIVDYEIRGELLRASKTAGLRRLDQLQSQLRYLPLTTQIMREAANLWAHMRQQGQPTAPDVALDIDVILAAQALALVTSTDSAVVATTNVGHLSRMVSAKLWHEIS